MTVASPKKFLPVVASNFAANNKSSAKFYTIVAIDTNSATPYVGPHRKLCGRRICQSRLSGKVELFYVRAWIISGLQLRVNTVRRHDVFFGSVRIGGGRVPS